MLGDELTSTELIKNRDAEITAAACHRDVADLAATTNLLTSRVVCTLSHLTPTGIPP